jgi:CheY-like chemotaxis protein
MTESPTGRRPPEILLVEDHESDVVLAREAFKRGHHEVNLHHVGNGAQCMEYLRKQGAYADAPTPDIILLDLNMPFMNGQEVLVEMQKDAGLRHLPVVVLTSSGYDRDVRQMYELRCNSYITKPLRFAEFQRIVESLMDYWFSVVALPERAGV